MPAMPKSCSTKEVIGLLPAGGHGTRIAPIPCSKEIFPIGFHPPESRMGTRPKAAAHYLAEKMRMAGAQKAFFILRSGKWDIAEYFRDGSIVGLPLGYLMMDLPYGVPFTLDQARLFVDDATILFGFPDILFQPDDAFVRLLERQAQSDADLVAGLFPAHQPQKMDMVGLDPDGRMVRITIKPFRTNLRYTWIIAVWSGRFTHFMHEFVAQHRKMLQKELEPAEIYLGEVIQAAIDERLAIENVIFDDGSYIDIGSPEDLAAAVRRPI
jgi:glucose-1-phosphate thymidylyltransferase